MMGGLGYLVVMVVPLLGRKKENESCVHTKRKHPLGTADFFFFFDTFVCFLG